MSKPFHLLLVITALLCAGIACDGSGDGSPASKVELLKPVDVLEKGDRMLEIHITDPEDGNYDESIKRIQDLGTESVSLSIFWDEIEVSPGVYNPDPNWLEIANLYYPPQDLNVSLVISVLDTTEVRLPKDLQGKSMADPETIQRFIDLLGQIQTQIPDLELTSVAIGNEIDGVLGSDQNAWSEFQTFFEAVAPEARELWPGVPIGTKIQFSGLTGPMKDAAKKVNASADIIMATYYPLNADFSMQKPDVVLDDFQRITDIYPGREIHFNEIGYSTSETIHSSPKKQADFIHYMFQAWDENSDQIKMISYSWLTDLPISSVRELESYYGLSDPGFAEFLRTLGLRTFPGSGEDKIGYEAFKLEARARGW